MKITEGIAVLTAWTALEALSPQTYRRVEDLADGDGRRIAVLSKNKLPWSRSGESDREGYRLYYQIILGAIPMSRATEELMRCFGSDEEYGEWSSDKAVIASILVDETGALAGEKSIAISSFAWALPLALNLDFKHLSAWSHVEADAVHRLTEILQRVDQVGKPLPLDFAAIDSAFNWIKNEFGLLDHLTEVPSFAVRTHHSLKLDGPPELPLLNSFYLRDLAKATSHVRNKTAPAALFRYLGINAQEQTVDLLNDNIELDKAVAPLMMPSGRWPSPGGHPLVLLQQAAVNLSRAELADSEGIIAVNGPPGTGKTTLLRDLVAACVVDRASAMVHLEEPEQGFVETGDKVEVGENASFKLFKLKDSLKGHEILVASSNNKAVENLSKELPAVGAIGRTVEDIDYFKFVSELLFSIGTSELFDGSQGDEPAFVNNGGKGIFSSSSDNSDCSDSGNQRPPYQCRTWGLCAAVLGNGRNRLDFKRAFWWHPERSFRLYLKAAKGDKVGRIIEECNEPIGSQRTSDLSTLKPPTPQEIRINWKKAKERFISLKHSIDSEFKALEDVRQLCHELYLFRLNLAQQKTKHQELLFRKNQTQANLVRDSLKVDSIKHDSSVLGSILQLHRQHRPNIFHQLLRTKIWNGWSQLDEQCFADSVESRCLLENAQKECLGSLAEFDYVRSLVVQSEESLIRLQKHMDGISAAVDAQRAILGERLVDEHFYFRSHEELQVIAPWISEKLHRKREELFVAALAVHKAFIDASAGKIFHNLSILMDSFGGPPRDEVTRKYLGDLWSTLFLVVPVLSSTFASVERMFGDLATGSIGWLLIDEAGQALPQAAVGSLMRAKRAIVVGDPLQIPPVVSLSRRLSDEICRYFKVDPLIVSAPEASVQTLADRSSKFQSFFRSEQGPRRVGLPLLVHRRCQEPMFGISNRIAYDGQMVHAAGVLKSGAIGAVLGPSGWFDVARDEGAHFCPAEGEFVVALIKQLVAAGVSNPDLFIVTPFKDVANKLRQRLTLEEKLLNSTAVDIPSWIKNRVGTIHTVQGREADTVLLVLGASGAAKKAARDWATQTPNILNVAVTRAKQNLYVIGSFDAWSDIGHARELSTLPRKTLSKNFFNQLDAASSFVVNSSSTSTQKI